MFYKFLRSQNFIPFFQLATLQEIGLQVFRSNDDTLIHVFHTKDCDVNIPQYEACRKTRAQQIAPNIVLEQIWRERNMPNNISNREAYFEIL